MHKAETKHRVTLAIGNGVRALIATNPRLAESIYLLAWVRAELSIHVFLLADWFVRARFTEVSHRKVLDGVTYLLQVVSDESTTRSGPTLYMRLYFILCCKIIREYYLWYLLFSILFAVFCKYKMLAPLCTFFLQYIKPYNDDILVGLQCITLNHPNNIWYSAAISYLGSEYLTHPNRDIGIQSQYQYPGYWIFSSI
jgi:hypothetical protein